jgi:hypothetical protein
MKKQRSIRPRFDNLESKVLLSTALGPQAAEGPRPPSALVDVARPPVQLLGYVYSGTGTVSPMGGVRANINVAQHLVTLRNGHGAVQVRLTQVYKYPRTFTARAFKILKATGWFKAFRGQGHASVTAIVNRGRVSVWSASFYV